MFAAVRIRSARETGASFRRPANFQIDGFMGRVFAPCGAAGGIGWSCFAPDAAGRAGEMVWHRTQTTEKRPDGSLVVGMELSDLREVKRWILSWGSECEVVEPKELRGMVRNEAEGILKGNGNG